MEDKTHYAPTIEEFHVGFEYEIKPFNKEWGEHDRSFIYPDGIYNYTRIHGIESLESPIEKGCVRVKYLDKEDIESFGFVYDKTSIPGETQWKFYKDNVCLFYRPKTKELGTFTVDPSKNDYMMEYIMDNKQAHILIIKNKSELKRLLNQLRI